MNQEGSEACMLIFQQSEFFLMAMKSKEAMLKNDVCEGLIYQ